MTEIGKLTGDTLYSKLESIAITDKEMIYCSSRMELFLQLITMKTPEFPE